MTYRATPTLRNIVIYISDSLRYDIAEQELAKYGILIKCVAQSTFTPTSLASLFTGFNPPRHGVFGFGDVLPKKIISVFDLPLEASLYAHPQSALYYTFRNPPRISIQDIREPFLYVEHSEETHIPYDKSYCTAMEYRKRVVWKSEEKLLSDYRRAFLRSVERFKKIIRVLKERDILHRTLIIFTSDHGELLGEYGFYEHHIFMAPQSIYVPLLIVHPKYDKGLIIKGKIARLVDIMPTICSILGICDEHIFEGINIFELIQRPDLQAVGFSYLKRLGYGLTWSGIWTYNGGMVQLRGPILGKIKALVHDYFIYTRRIHVLKYLKRKFVYGTPPPNADIMLSILENKPSYGLLHNIAAGPDEAQYEKEVLKVKILGVKYKLHNLSNSKK